MSQVIQLNRHPDLTETQRRVMDLFLQGKTSQETADEVGLDLYQVDKLRLDPVFDEVYRARLSELEEQLYSMCFGKALRVLSKLGDMALGEDGIKATMPQVTAAKTFLELCGYHKNAPIQRPSDSGAEDDLEAILDDMPESLLREALERKKKKTSQGGA